MCVCVVLYCSVTVNTVYYTTKTFHCVYRYYWYNRVIRVSDDIGDAGEFNWQLLICMFCAWLITYLCLFRGIKSSGKVSGWAYCYTEIFFYDASLFPKFKVLCTLFYSMIDLVNLRT